MFRNLGFALLSLAAMACNEGVNGGPDALAADVLPTELPGDMGDKGPDATPCPLGSLEVEPGRCIAVGIPSCVPEFRDDKGLCLPSADRCPANTIPRFDEGCVAVGIPDCASEFLDDAGVCRPGIEACSPGSIPVFSEGCQAVGLHPCPAVFESGSDGVCRPTRSTCDLAAGEIPVPSAGCLPLERFGPCPTDPWAGIEDPEGSFLYVDPTGDPDVATGRRDAPYPTLGTVIDLAPEGATIVLAPGTYPGPFRAARSLTILGSCVAGTRLVANPDATPDSDTLILEASGDVQVILRNVTLQGPGTGILAADGARLQLSNARITGVVPFGILAAGAGTAVQAHRVLFESIDAIREPSTWADYLWMGTAVFVANGAQVVLDQSAIVDSAYHGVDVVGAGSNLTATDTVWFGPYEYPEPHDKRSFGRAVYAGDGATVDLESCAILDSLGDGIIAWDPGTRVHLRRVLVRNTRDDVLSKGGRHGVGIAAADGARIDVQNSIVAASAGAGLRATDPGAILTASRSLIRDGGLDNGTLAYGYGGLVESGGTMHLMESSFVDNVLAGLVIQPDEYLPGKRSLISLFRILVQGTRLAKPTGDTPAGLYTAFGTTAVVRDSAFVRNEGMGVVADGRYWGNPALLSMEGSLVEGTFLSRVKGAPEFGAGVWVQEGATAYVTGCRIEGNEVLGVVARDPDTELFLDGNRISDTVSRRDGLFGQGVTILDEAWARIDDNTLVGNRDTGVLIARTGRAIANRNVIEDTLNEAGSDRFGRGISVLLDGSLVLNGNLLRNNRDASITVSSGGLLEGSGNRILDTMPGESGWFGHGIAADQGAEITLAGTLVQASRGAGLSVLGSTLDMKGSVVSSTVSGTAPDPSGIGSVSLAGDGLLAISFGGDRNGLDIRDSWFLGNTGAGMRLYESDGSVLDTVSSANDFGLVYMQANGLDAEDSNRFEGNREQDVVIVDSTAAAAMSFAPSPQSSIPEGW